MNKNYELAYHTFGHDNTYSKIEVEERQYRSTRFMTDKFMKELTPERIFVRKGDGPGEEQDIRALARTIRKRGDPNVLRVCNAEHSGQIGQVEWLD